MDVNRDIFVNLMVDDGDDEFFLFKKELEGSHFDCHLRHVPDGRELMDDLLRQREQITSEDGPRPFLILSDLNMPGKHRRDVLIEIKSIPKFKHIPVIVYTSSGDEEDVSRSYALGANSYIVKPAEWDQLINMIRNLCSYWTRTVRLPKAEFIASPKIADHQSPTRLVDAIQ